MPSSRSDKGFVLLFVLWLLVLLALVASHMTILGDRQAKTAHNLVVGAEVEAAADGAVYDAVFRLASGAMTGNALVYQSSVGGLPVSLKVTNEGLKLNPNTAKLDKLSALLEEAGGLNAGQASFLARNILDWRGDGNDKAHTAAIRATYLAAGKNYAPPHEPFRSLDELGDVLGMTPALLARLKPHLSLYAPNGPPLPAQVVAIEAQATGPDGAVFRRAAVVKLAAPYPMLAWGRP
jgi:general secretion pathway protein K